MNCPNCKSDFKYNRDKPIVVLCVPALDSTIHFSILNQWDYILKNYRGLAVVIESTYIDMARNKLVAEGFKRSRSVYEQEPDYFLFIDSDTVVGKRDPTGSGFIQPYPEYLDQLMKRDKPAISGYYVKKCDPYAQKPVFGKGHTEAMYVEPLPTERVTEVNWFGGGYLLVKAEVFAKVEAPWFENRNDGKGAMGAQIVGEDIYFCKKLKENGIPLFVDLDCKIGHAGGVAWPPEEEM